MGPTKEKGRVSHILVDFDGTLAVYVGWTTLGPPIERMMWQVREWIRDGKEVRIFTARVAPGKDQRAQREMIQEWCREYLGKTLQVINEKDGHTEAIYDDKAFRVEKNTGVIL